MVRSQQPRRGRVRKQAVAVLEDAVGGEEPHRAGERLRVNAGRLGEHVGALWLISQGVGNAEVGDRMEATRQHGAARHLQNGRDRRRVR